MTDNPTRYGSKLIPDNYHESGSKDFLRPQTKFWALADYFSHVERGVTSSTYFSLLGLRIRLSLAPLKSNSQNRSHTANAAFCLLVFSQLPSSQLDMAEACGSRICDDRSNRQCLCGVAHHTLLPISAF